jgi:hypothetical protein
LGLLELGHEWPLGLRQPVAVRHLRKDFQAPELGLGLGLELELQLELELE